MIITTHACERYLERELGLTTWTRDDINRVASMSNSNV
jgi:hypothetical protein